MKIWLNGKIVNEQEAVVSVYDHGFLYGIGLFETFRTYGGKPFLLQQHLDRMKAGCGELGITYQPELPRIEDIVSQLLAANQLDDAYIRFTVSAGKEALGLPAGDYDAPSFIMYVKPLPKQDDALYAVGKPLQLLQMTKRNTPEGSVRFKSLHYMNNILAKRELAGYKWAAGAEGLLVSESGHLAEGIVSNLFFIKDGRCCTPAISTGILPGVTRAFVLELAQKAGYAIEEGYYNWIELCAADEVFLTNSIQELVPVTRLFDPSGAEIIVGQGKIGPLNANLLELYRKSTQAV